MHRVFRRIIGDAEIKQPSNITQFEVCIAADIIDSGIGETPDAVGQGSADIEGLSAGCGRQCINCGSCAGQCGRTESGQNQALQNKFLLYV